MQLAGADSNLLEGNFKKYQTMNIYRKGVKEHNADVINIKDTHINPSRSVKLLGVTIDDKLCFSEHITPIC